jgi:hypothetical protein
VKKKAALTQTDCFHTIAEVMEIGNSIPSATYLMVLIFFLKTNPPKKVTIGCNAGNAQLR